MYTLHHGHERQRQRSCHLAPDLTEHWQNPRATPYTVLPYSIGSETDKQEWVMRCAGRLHERWHRVLSGIVKTPPG